jgi:dienelactone hydrolase
MPAPPHEILGEQTVGATLITRVRYAGGDDASVPAFVFRPRQPGPAPGPALVIQHGANTSKDDFYIQAPARRWAAAGWTVLAIDLAEHGERIVGEPIEPMRRRRLIMKPPFVAQGVADLRRGVDLLATLPGVDPARIAFTGFSLGAMLGTVFTAQEPRIGAAAIVIAGSFAHLRYWERGDGDEERASRRAAAEATDPAFFAPHIAPRPLLMVNTLDDPVFPRDAVETLFAAAAEPKELRWHPGTHHEWKADVFKDVWLFLDRTIGDRRGPL